MTISSNTSRIEAIGFFFWMLKDFSWQLLIPPLAWLSVAIALVIQVYLMVRPPSSDLTQMHRLAGLFWLLGSAAYMSSDMLWQHVELADGCVLPWWEHPLLSDGEGSLANAQMLEAARVCFIGALVVLGILYISAGLDVSIKGTTSRTGDFGLGWLTPEQHQQLFLCPWIAKDYFLCVGNPFPAMLLDLSTTLIFWDCTCRYGQASVPYLLWSMGDFISSMQDLYNPAVRTIGVRCIISALEAAAMGFHVSMCFSPHFFETSDALARSKPSEVLNCQPLGECTPLIAKSMSECPSRSMMTV